MSDPWKDRAKHMKCPTCMWYAEKTATVGRCRRHSPTMTGYPVVYKDDWCGDHKVDEVKHENRYPSSPSAGILGKLVSVDPQ